MKVERSLSSEEATKILQEGKEDPDNAFYVSKKKTLGHHILILAIREKNMFKIYHPATGKGASFYIYIRFDFSCQG